MLDGGLPNWKARGFPTSHGTPRIVTPAPYKAGFNPSLVRTFEQMMDNFTSKKEQVGGRGLIPTSPGGLIPMSPGGLIPTSPGGLVSNYMYITNSSRDYKNEKLSERVKKSQKKKIGTQLGIEPRTF